MHSTSPLCTCVHSFLIVFVPSNEHCPSPHQVVAIPRHTTHLTNIDLHDTVSAVPLGSVDVYLFIHISLGTCFCYFMNGAYVNMFVYLKLVPVSLIVIVDLQLHTNVVYILVHTHNILNYTPIQYMHTHLCSQIRIHLCFFYSPFHFHVSFPFKFIIIVY